MGKKALRKTWLPGLFVVCMVILAASGRSANAADAEGAVSCPFPLDCAVMDYNPCCQAAACKEVLLSPTQCIEKAELEKGTTTVQGRESSLLTTSHYHMIRAGTCPSNFKLTSWGESRSLPIGSSSSVYSTTTTGTIASTHLTCSEDLPDNATITNLAIYGYDYTSGGYIYSCLYKSHYLSTSGTAIACITSTSVGEAGWSSSTVSESVDNGYYTYYVSSYVSPGYDSSLKIYTVEVRYTTP